MVMDKFADILTKINRESGKYYSFLERTFQERIS
jgi:hypothetical protein